MSNPAPSGKTYIVSTGRGGSGNIGVNDPSKDKTEQDLRTPHIKQDRFTTGRGGSGNMMINHPDVPEMARAAQDADFAPVRSEAAPGPNVGSITTGRGGGGNMVRQDSRGAPVTPSAEPAEEERKGRRGSFLGEAKELLSSLRGNSKARKDKEGADKGKEKA